MAKLAGLMNENIKLKKMIEKLNLKNRVDFLGNLTEEEKKKYYRTKNHRRSIFR